jgi:hypothetical protein
MSNFFFIALQNVAGKTFQRIAVIVLLQPAKHLLIN